MPPLNQKTDITADVLDRIKKEAAFYDFVCTQYRCETERAGLMPRFLPNRLFFVYEAWKHDTDRISNTIGKGDGQSKPDHFKQCGFLVYWLRRFAPAYDYREERYDSTLSPREKEFREFLFKYEVEYPAFSLGARICLFFEKNKNHGTVAVPKMTPEYIETICYFMKYKHVSPHGLTLIYKSLFI